MNNFKPLANEYTGNESNSLTVVFTNTREYVPVGPTGVSLRTGPFGWIALAGMALLMGAILPGKRRRREEP